MTALETRQALLYNILHDTPRYREAPLEVNPAFISHAFNDVPLPIWCRAVGVRYRINTNPLEEFRSRHTFLFWRDEDHEEEEPWVTRYEDNEL